MNNSKKMKISIIVIIIAIILIDQITKLVAINNNYTIGIVSFHYEEQEVTEKDEIISSLLTDIIVFIIVIKFFKEQNKRIR